MGNVSIHEHVQNFVDVENGLTNRLNVTIAALSTRGKQIDHAHMVLAKRLVLVLALKDNERTEKKIGSNSVMFLKK